MNAPVTAYELSEAVELANALCVHAYTMGFHECGYDPIERLYTAIAERDKTINDLAHSFALAAANQEYRYRRAAEKAQEKI